MGSYNSINQLVTLNYYASKMHPTEGIVNVYKFKGDQHFIFKKEKTSKLLMIIASKIAHLESPFLSQYYGNLQQNDEIAIHENWQCLQKHSPQNTFWGYHNYSLRRQIQKNLKMNKLPIQQQCWKLILDLCKGQSLLVKHQLFLNLSLDNVYLNLEKSYLVYWGNVQPSNQHRAFYKQMMDLDYQVAEILSPEQAKKVKARKFYGKLDLQKCVIFTLGVLLLQYVSNITNYELIFDLQTYQLKPKPLGLIINKMKGIYSSPLITTILNLIDETPTKRLKFEDLLKLSEANLLQCKRSEKQSRLEDKNITHTTCSSSKVSIKLVK